MPKDSPTKKRQQERLDKKGESNVRHDLRDSVVRAQKSKRQLRDVRNSGRRGDTGG